MTEALLIVDVQNDFCKGGSLAVGDADFAIPFINMMIGVFQHLELPIIYTRDWHPEETPHFGEPPQGWPIHCVAGTEGAKFFTGLEGWSRAGTYQVRKGLEQDHGYSAFSEPQSCDSTPESDDPLGYRWKNLDALLKEKGITELTIVGLATDFCVLQTALDARKLGYSALVPLECTAPVYPDKIVDVLQQYLDAGVILYVLENQLTQEAVDMMREEYDALTSLEACAIL